MKKPYRVNNKIIKIIHVVGTRPNFMKLAPLFFACRKRNFSQQIIHTGQHYDINMSKIFFSQLRIPSPDINLGVGSGSHAQQTAQIMLGLERKLINNRPDWVIVYGDVNSTLTAALVCSKLNIKIAHVEAGLRSFDRTMPEEINRLLTDQLADLLFTHSQEANKNLLKEGIKREKIHFVGNIMIDTLIKLLPLAKTIKIRKKIPHDKNYILVTLHRPSNVDKPIILQKIVNCLERISSKIPIIFSVHPRTQEKLRSLKRLNQYTNLYLIDPLSYLEFLNLEAKAKAVITDSGGIQEETTFLGIPCLTLRENTERPITVELGTNKLIGNDYKLLEQEVNTIIRGRYKKGKIPPFWDGHTAERIAKIIAL